MKIVEWKGHTWKDECQFQLAGKSRLGGGVTGLTKRIWDWKTELIELKGLVPNVHIKYPNQPLVEMDTIEDQRVGVPPLNNSTIRSFFAPQLKSTHSHNNEGDDIDNDGKDNTDNSKNKNIK